MHQHHQKQENRPFLTPSRTIITSFTPRKPTSFTANNSPYDGGDWVLCLTSDRDDDGSSTQTTTTTTAPETIACALSNGEVQVYDTQRLHLARSFKEQSPQVGNASTSRITDLKYGPQNSLVSADQNGLVKVFDLRQAKVGSQVQLPPGQPALCMDFGFEGGYLAAVGSSKARVHFYDLRNPSQLLGSYVDSHRDDITQVAFYKPGSSSSSSSINNQNNVNANNGTAGLLLTASEDGLMCLFDTTQPTEETALKSVINVNAPIRKAGFCNNNALYCLTGNETLSLWNGETGSLIYDFGWNSRQDMLSAAKSSSPNNSGVTSSLNSIDYLVDARYTNGQLVVLAGDSTGNSALFKVSNNPHNHHNGNNGQRQWHLDHLESLVGGHRGVVRAWCPLGNDPNSWSLVTAGEDARLCEWQTNSSAQGRRFNHEMTQQQQPQQQQLPPHQSFQRQSSLGSKRTATGGPIRRQRHKPSATPY
mmetsp:Transcript_5282/g.14829  ORF Transcript_5282/g.14829 Transcript_5282/m.14829 type:complete len:476 (+) Transcript_5282:130-1557(+)